MNCVRTHMGMQKRLFARLSVLLAVLSILCASGDAQAQNLVKNGGFENFSGTTPKGHFNSVQPDSWGIGPAVNGALAFIYAPGTASDGTQISVWPTFPTSSAGGTSTAGGNFLGSDGDFRFSGLISQTLIGLQPNQQYEVSYLHAAGQEVNFFGPTTEWWDVSLAGLPAQPSFVFSLPSQGVGQWRAQTHSFTTPAVLTNSVLTFLARGTPTGLPPVNFLDDVCVVKVGDVCAVPEPGSLLIIGVGLLVSVGVGRIRRAKSGKV